jgi:hypothetical protein
MRLHVIVDMIVLSVVVSLSEDKNSHCWLNDDVSQIVDMIVDILIIITFEVHNVLSLLVHHC